MVIRTDDDARIIMRATTKKEMVIGGADTYTKAQIDDKLDGKQDVLEEYVKDVTYSGSKLHVTDKDGNVTDYTISGGGGGGTTDHAELDNLDYYSSGHTGFAKENGDMFVDFYVDRLYTNRNIAVAGVINSNNDVTVSRYGNTESLLNKVDKTIFNTETVMSALIFNLSNQNGKSLRCSNTLTQGITIAFETDGDYSNDFMCELSFRTGSTAPSMDYSGTGIIQWVGSECKNVSDFSIFAPVANKTYDILIYFNGLHFVGLVNGYEVASGN